MMQCLVFLMQCWLLLRQRLLRTHCWLTNAVQRYTYFHDLLTTGSVVGPSVDIFLTQILAPLGHCSSTNFNVPIIHHEVVAFCHEDVVTSTTTV